MLTSKICRFPLRLSQPWSESRSSTRADQLVFPLALLLAGAGLSLSTFSLRQLGTLCNKDDHRRR